MFLMFIVLFYLSTETNPLVEDADNLKVDYAFDNPAFKGEYRILLN